MLSVVGKDGITVQYLNCIQPTMMVLYAYLSINCSEFIVVVRRIALGKRLVIYYYNAYRKRKTSPTYWSDVKQHTTNELHRYVRLAATRKKV